MTAKETKIDIMSTKMIDEVYRFFDVQVEKEDLDFKKALEKVFLAKLVAAITLDALMERPLHKPSKKELLKFVMNNFNNCKLDVQEAVGAGVGAAMTKMNGRIIEYFCQLHIVPEPANKEPC